MDTTQKIVVGLSVGTLAFFAGVVGLLMLSFGLLFVLHYPKQQVAPVVPPYVAPPMFGTRGAADAAARKQALDAELGPVNTAAKQEVKNGLFANMRARAACRAAARTAAICGTQSAPSVAYVPTGYTYTTPVRVYQPAPIVYPSVYPSAIFPAAPINPPPLYQPVPKPMAGNPDEIDFQSCDQYGTCALRGGR